MSDEQRVILQMVSQGKITADDGVKLLEALGLGEEKRRDREAPAGKARRRNILFRTVGDQIPDIGHMVRTVVNDAISGIRMDQQEPEADFCMVEGEGGEPIGEGIELAPGTELVLRPLCTSSGGDVALAGVKGSLCRSVSPDQPEIRVYRDGSTVWLRWNEGDMSLEIPETVDRVTVDIMGGSLASEGLLSRVRLRSKGGDISIREARRGFDAKTMGGDMLVTLTEAWGEDSRISTMGGDITIAVADAPAANVTARSFGGSVFVQEELGEVTESGRPGSSRLRLVIGDREDRPDFRIDTMGGNIRIVGAWDPDAGDGSSDLDGDGDGE